MKPDTDTILGLELYSHVGDDGHLDFPGENIPHHLPYTRPHPYTPGSPPPPYTPG